MSEQAIPQGDASTSNIPEPENKLPEPEPESESADKDMPESAVPEKLESPAQEIPDTSVDEKAAAASGSPDWTSIDKEFGPDKKAGGHGGVDDPVPKVGVDIRQMGGTGNVVAGNVEHQTIIAAKQSAFSLTRYPIELQSKVFVPPPEYQEAQKDSVVFTSRRVLVVHGTAKTGRLTCAVNWGLEYRLLEDSELLCHAFRRQPATSLDLLEAVEDKMWPAKSVVIFENAFSADFSPRQLDESYLSELSAKLIDKTSLLILTTELQLSELIDLDTTKIGTSSLDLKEVLKKHLEHFSIHQSLAERVLGEWPQLEEILRRPYLVLRYVRACLASKLAEVDVVELAREVCWIDQGGIRAWFNGLTTNQKLFALLAFLFEGADREDLIEVYSWSIEVLHASNFAWARDVRLLGMLDLMETVFLEPDSTIVQFQEPLIRQELGRQCANRHLLLWSVLEPAVRMLVQKGRWIGGKLTWRLAIAVGRLGVWDQERFGQAFVSWAAAGHPLLSGCALAHFVATEGGLAPVAVVLMLRDWLGSAEPRLVLAAGSACWQIYREVEVLPSAYRQAIRVNLLQQLDLLASRAGHSDLIAERTKEFKQAFPNESASLLKVEAERSVANEVLTCTAFALEQIWYQDPSAAEEVLCDWLGRVVRWPHRQTALWTVANLFEKLGRGKIPLSFKQPRFRKLVERALAAAEPGTVGLAAILIAFLKWIRRSDSRDSMLEVLLTIANFGGLKTGENLRSGIAQFWLTTQLADKDLEKIAGALIARSRMISGALVDYPDLGSAAFAIDPNFFPVPRNDRQKSEREFDSLGFASNVAASIKVLFDLQIFRLGHCQDLDLSATIAEIGAENVTPAHRLLVPSLEVALFEAKCEKNFAAIVILSNADIIDLADITDRNWASKVLEIRADDARSERESDSNNALVLADSGFSIEHLRKVEHWLESSRNSALVGALPEAWQMQLKRYGYDSEDWPAFDAKMRADIETMEELGSLKGELDLIRGAMLALLWRAFSDRESLLALMAGWLDPVGDQPDQVRRRAMAAACARILLRIHSAVVPHPQAAIAMDLFEKLAQPLAKWHRDGAVAMLVAVEKWIEDPEMRGYLGGDIQEGRGRFQRWAEEHLDDSQHDKKALARISDLLAREGGGAVESALASAVDQISYRFAVGSVVELPMLGEGRRHGLFVVDPQSPKATTDLACKIAQELAGTENGEIQAAIYRLGERQASLVDGFDHKWDLKKDVPRLPPLLGALLGSLDPQDVAFVLVFGGRAILDEEDWIGTSWYERIYAYQPRDLSDRALALQVVPEFTSDLEAKSIAAYLSRRASFRWKSAESNNKASAGGQPA